MTVSRPYVILYLNNNQGIYIPRDFVLSTRPEYISGCDPDDLAVLREGPEHERYWEAWESVCNSARVTDPSTQVVYTLYQDGALWLVPDGMEWDDREGWVWPPAESAET